MSNEQRVGGAVAALTSARVPCTCTASMRDGEYSEPLTNRPLGLMPGARAWV